VVIFVVCVVQVANCPVPKFTVTTGFVLFTYWEEGVLATNGAWTPSVLIDASATVSSGLLFVNVIFACIVSGMGALYATARVNESLPAEQREVIDVEVTTAVLANSGIATSVYVRLNTLSLCSCKL